MSDPTIEAVYKNNIRLCKNHFVQRIKLLEQQGAFTVLYENCLRVLDKQLVTEALTGKPYDPLFEFEPSHEDIALARSTFNNVSIHNLSNVSDEEYPEYLKSLRWRNGWTQRQLGEMLCVAASTVSQWEQGRRKVPGPVKVLILLLHFSFTQALLEL